MRDALSIFDKVAGASGEKITYKDVISNLNILDYEYYFRMVDAFIKCDLPSVLNILDEVVRNGFDTESFVQGLAEHFRELLVAKDVNTIGLMECSEAVRQRYFNQASLAEEGFVLTALQILNTCDLTLGRAANKRLHTEISLSKICYAKQAYAADFFAGQSDAIKKMM